MNEILLSVQNLAVSFHQGGQAVKAVDGISFDIRRGETFALVGESGSGKSVTALSVMRLLPHNAVILNGAARLNEVDLLRIPEFEMGKVRGKKIGIIFQDPMSSLNPVMSIGRQVGEVLTVHEDLQKARIKSRVIELLGQVGLPHPEQHYDEYPHQLSGGMRQRAMIAIALAGKPDLLIADEPTTALDVTLQAQILVLLKRLQSETGMALWLITHDLAVVSEIADRVAVMRKGEIVEAADCTVFFDSPKHPYSWQLFDAMPNFASCLNRQTSADQPLLEVQDLKVYYPIKKGLLQRTVDHVRAVDGVSFSLAKGKTLALVGESGCGKTSIGKALLNLIDSNGKVLFEGQDVSHSKGASLKKRCADLQIIFQDPFAAMNPRMLVGDIIDEGMRALLNLSDQQRLQRVIDLLQAVGLPESARLRYPHEFSGGQRQRICIARALAVEPKLIICDEPTSALDVSVQKQILDLLKALREQKSLSYLFISHDLGVVAELADRIAVMYQGKIVEMGSAEAVLYSPSHPYTKKLLQAVPKLKGM